MSVTVPSGQVVFDHLTAVRFAPVRFAPVRFAPLRFAPVKVGTTEVCASQGCANNTSESAPNHLVVLSGV